MKNWVNHSPNKSIITANFLNIVKSDKNLILIPLLTIITRIVIFSFVPFTYEDAFITFRYAENLANGSGLVYNLGEKVYGTTAPLFAILLGFFKFLGVSCIISSLSLNLLAEGLTSLIVYKFLKDYSDRIITAIVALLYVFSPPHIRWSIQGMETAFFIAFIALSFFSLYKKKYTLALLFGFLTAILRIDGLSVVFIIFIFSFIEKKFSAFKYILIPLLIFLIWLTALYLYFGSFLPNSMIAKLILYSGHRTSMLPGINLLFEKFFAMGYYTSTIITIFFLIGTFQIFYKKINLYPMIIWFFVYYFALVISKTVIHAWYLTPPLFVFITVSGIGIIFSFQNLLRILRLNKILFQSLLFIGILFFSFIMLNIKIKEMYGEYQYEQIVRKPIGKFLKENTPQNSSVFLEPIGIIGYFSNRYIYDDIALITPRFLEINKLPYNAESQYKKIQLVRPDYLVLRDIYLEEFYSTTNLQNDYKAIQNFSYYINPKDTAFLSMTIFERKE